jgi:hypothetical protein
MTDIDPQADIELHPADEHVTVRVPLAGAVTGEWLRCYQKLAEATNVPVQAQARHDQAWIVVSVPAGSDQVEVVATMDAARALIAEADAAAEPSPATAKVEAAVRDWWAGSRGNAASGNVAAGAGAEKRWPMAVTLVLAMAVPLVLPARFSLGPRWAVPVVEVLLLVAIIATDRGHIDRWSAVGRVLSLVLVAVLVADAAGVTARLIGDLIQGGPETNSAADLLKTGFLVWLYTIIAFAFVYWVLDGGGPESRFLAPPEFPDLAFPAQLNPGVARPGWHPEFSTTFTSGSPTPPRSARPM